MHNCMKLQCKHTSIATNDLVASSDVGLSNSNFLFWHSATEREEI